MENQTEVIGDKVVVRPMFKEGQRVWHVAPESETGIVIDWSYRSSTGLVYYTVALGFDKEVVCLENELSITKTF